MPNKNLTHARFRESLETGAIGTVEHPPESLDVRALPAGIRYPTVEEALETLEPGRVVRVVGDVGADLFLRRLRKRFGKRYAFQKASGAAAEAIVCRRNW